MLSGIFYWTMLPFRAPSSAPTGAPCPAEREHRGDRRRRPFAPDRARDADRVLLAALVGIHEVRSALLVGGPALGERVDRPASAGGATAGDKYMARVKRWGRKFTWLP